MKRNREWLIAAGVAAVCAGCIHTKSEVEIKPVEIKPIQISMDVKVKVDDALHDADRNADPAMTELFDRLHGRRETLELFAAEGAVGESNQGRAVNRLPEDDRSYRVVQQLVDAENKDRDEIVARIAAKRRLSAEEVRVGWAERTAEKAAPGTWLEDAEGNWYQK